MERKREIGQLAKMRLRLCLGPPYQYGILAPMLVSSRMGAPGGRLGLRVSAWRRIKQGGREQASAKSSQRIHRAVCCRLWLHRRHANAPPLWGAADCRNTNHRRW